MIIVIMGVSGCGKSTIGQLLSQKLSLPYFDADDFHPISNINKMRNGIPLTDEDRLPWLNDLAYHFKKWESEKGAILACSALKETYREILKHAANEICWIHLIGSFEVIQDRLDYRKEHYMSSDLLRSQFDSLESPDYAFEISITKSPKEIIELIRLKLKAHE